MASAWKYGSVGLVLAVILAVGLACSPSSAPPAPAATAAATRSAQAPAATSAPATAPAAQPGPPRKVRYGELKLLGDAGIYVGIDEGYFAEHGIELELVTFD